MNLIKVRHIIILVCLCSCANWQRTDQTSTPARLLDHQLRVALADYRTVHGPNVAPLFPVITSLRLTYCWLPASVEPIINSGTNSIPFLMQYRGSNDLIEQELTRACIRLLKAPQLEKSRRQKD